MMKAIRVHAHGDSSALLLEDVPVPSPGPHQLLVKVAAAGVNFVDTYLRTGLYKPASLPFIMGKEGAGVVEAAGEEAAKDVAVASVGARVSFVASSGSYAEYTLVEADKAIPVPEQVSLEEAAAVSLQGLTAYYLTTGTHSLRPNLTVLVHAGAGGTGALLIQMAKIAGATVFTTVSSEAKAAIAREAGADHVIVYTETDFEAEVKRLTNGVGVDVVYDSVGLSTWAKSLASCGRCGHLVCFGNASGAVPPIDPLLLMKAGSVSLTRPTLADYVPSVKVLRQSAAKVFAWMKLGQLRVRIDRIVPLSDAGAAQDLLTSRNTTGKLLLRP